MKKLTEENVIPLFAEEAKKQDENWRKSIPAQVFLNHFFAINYHLEHSATDAGLQHLSFLKNHQADLNPEEVAEITRLLHTCWSTEYALRSTAEFGDEAYLRHALYWTFPQAYYTVFSGIQAFLFTLGIKTNNADVIQREIGRLVVRNAYPKAIGFYAAGPYNDFNIHRLPLAAYKAGLQIAEKEIDAQAQIGQFLRTTRKQRAMALRAQIQANPNTAIRSPKTGDILNRWNAQHWQQITWRMGYTTFFDLLSRLRISSTHREIERFVEAEIDFTLFHKSLLNIVSYLNGVHESYVAKALGLEKYKQLLEELPPHLKNSFVEARFREKIQPLFGDEQELQLGVAA
ncbi:hypothetical protein [Adhaeribacter soli]|uniref:Uncharacterized protein n=1 Tax=Adhaeribacter soli TaxID=2607655 RepID=A0A5N1IMF3_9BACT|nr:hypothetical protein [Adhaeribacter soli]KAA9327335.1 hypothetical protein F0P94_15570 [Adhaeribacter soli]